MLKLTFQKNPEKDSKKTDAHKSSYDLRFEEGRKYFWKAYCSIYKGLIFNSSENNHIVL